MAKGKKKAASAAPELSAVAVDIPPINRQTMHVDLEGDSPLIMHAWSEKAKSMIRDKQQKKAKGGREKRNPEKEYKDSMYEYPGGGYGFPSIAFKIAAVKACRGVADIPMTRAKNMFHVNLGEELVKIEGVKPRMREDMVRIGNGVADLRYRGEFPAGWKVRIMVTFDADSISAEQIINLFNRAGFSVGVGEWRPDSPKSTGQNGMFHVKLDKGYRKKAAP